MATHRQGEDQAPQFYRSTRIYAANSLWWFDTREGVQFGPFICEIAAICSLAVYVAQHVHEAAVPVKKINEPPGSQDQISHIIEEVLDLLTQHRDFGEVAAKNWAEWRLEDLRSAGILTSDVVGRIRILEFSLRHPEQTFNFEYFLKCRAG